MQSMRMITVTNTQAHLSPISTKFVLMAKIVLAHGRDTGAEHAESLCTGCSLDSKGGVAVSIQRRGANGNR